MEEIKSRHPSTTRRESYTGLACYSRARILRSAKLACVRAGRARARYSALSKFEDELIGLHADGRIENDLAVVVLRVSQNLAFARQLETGGCDLGDHRRLIDAMKLGRQARTRSGRGSM